MPDVPDVPECETDDESDNSIVFELNQDEEMEAIGDDEVRLIEFIERAVEFFSSHFDLQIVI